MHPEDQINWQSAQSKAEANRQVHAEQITRTSKAHEQVFWHIFIAAPATISLSVTFVGYYINQAKLSKLDFREIGFAWGLLIAAMILSVLRNFAQASYNQYQTYYNQIFTKKEEVEAYTKLKSFDKNEETFLSKLTSEAKSARRARDLLGYIHPILGDVSLFVFSFGVIVLVHFIYQGLKVLYK